MQALPQPTQVSQPEAAASKGSGCPPGHRCLRPANLQNTCGMGGLKGGAWELPKFKSLYCHGGCLAVSSWPGAILALARTQGHSAASVDSLLPGLL